MFIDKKIIFNKRKALFLQNELIEIIIFPGGGHIARVALKAKDVNPLWVPPWKSIDPDKYSPKKHAKFYGGNSESKLLASISGHNICLDYFGAPSKEEEQAGLTVHGEAPVSTWKIKEIKRTNDKLLFNYGTNLPVADLSFNRTIFLRKNENIIYVKEKITNLSSADKPVCISEHVTFGPPFLKKGVTMFDMPAKWCRTNSAFSKEQRFKGNREFRWPYAPLTRGGKTDLRITFKEKKSSDFSAQQFDRDISSAWFTACNPEAGICFGYIFNRKDFPWIGNWEENYSRKIKPWDKKTMTRGMEFSTTPFPMPKREAVDLGFLHGEKTFRWIGAKSSIEYGYLIFIAEINKHCKGVNNIILSENKLELILRGAKKITLSKSMKGIL